MREFRYDVIQLIHGVRDRPCLWNKTIDEYKDRVERRSAWEEIFSMLEDTYDEMSAEEKRITGEHIVNKWTNVRDTFLKSLKTKMGKPKKKYLLYDHLEFLTKMIPEDERHRELHQEDPAPYMKQEVEVHPTFTITSDIEPETTNSFTISSVTSLNANQSTKRSDFDDVKSIEYDNSEVSYSTKCSKLSDFDGKSPDYNPTEVYSRKKRKSRFNYVDDNDSKDSSYNKRKSRKTRKDTRESVNDHLNDIDFVEVDDNDPRIMNEDEAFFASLLPTIVKYNEDERLEFRIEVLGIMKKIKDKRKWMGD